ncbi:MAG: DUF1934 domain-containing protein [Lachnospiraceae bacterium]|nr:DUF1934 domain-containing protein [Lachnospiraceae bacterium]
MQNVEIRITGMQKTPGQGSEEAVPVVTECKGSGRIVNGRRHVMYQEAQEGTRGITKTHMILGEDCLEVHRRGQTESTMIFRKGCKHVLSYRTPYGSIPMEVRTDRFAYSEKDGQIRVYVEYRLSSDGVAVSKNTNEIIVRGMN